MSNANELNKQLMTSPAGMTRVQGADNSSIRTIEEVKGAIMIAKLCPRDEDVALQKILKACQRKVLAEKALYEYERGDTAIEGPSIRLAEAVVLNWGNMQSGVRELERTEEETKYEAFAWDVENNTRSSKEFTVKHVRQTKSYGTKKLTDERDIYETVANHGARRKRACIIEVIPGYIMDMAVDACKETLIKLAGDQPKEERIKIMLGAFAEHGVSKEMIEKKYGCKIEALSEGHLVKLRAIYQGFQDGYANPENVFEFKLETGTKADALNANLKN